MINEKRRRTIRSFVLRQGRLTVAQQDALQTLWPKYGLEINQGLLDWSDVFVRDAPIILDIGFGQGGSLVNLAAHYTDHNVVGVEVHRPGIGHCLIHAHQLQLEHLRVICGDCTEVVQRAIPDNSLHRIYILFPDPWHKKRHQKRRLIQPEFLSQLVSKLQHGGVLHIATDWQDYAEYIARVIETVTNLQKQPAESSWRPQTKYEQRGLRLGHSIYDFVYTKL